MNDYVNKRNDKYLKLSECNIYVNLIYRSLLSILICHISSCLFHMNEVDRSNSTTRAVFVYRFINKK